MVMVRRIDVIDQPAPTSLDEAIAIRDEANRRLYWHLSQAVTFSAGGHYLGPRFDHAMREAERARVDWHAAQTAIFNWNPQA